MEDTETRRSGGGFWKFMLFLLIVLVAMGTYLAYQYGEGSVYIDGRTISELKPWEVVGAVAIGLVGAVVGLAAGALGIIIALVATLLAMALAILGIVSGLFITVGVILGPFLLIALIVVLLRRRNNPDVI